MIIQVVRCLDPQRWYSKLIGQIFEVERCAESEYFIYRYAVSQGLYNFFDYRDIEEVIETKPIKSSNKDCGQNPIIKIKIVKCSDPLTRADGPRWYKNHIGEIFEVNYFNYTVPMYDLPLYVLSDGRTIAIQDVEEIKETKMKVVEKAMNDVYPCLKVNNGLVVLFSEKETGTVVKSDGLYHIGYYQTDWAEENFTLYNGTLELSNGD